MDAVFDVLFFTITFFLLYRVIQFTKGVRVIKQNPLGEEASNWFDGFENKEDGRLFFRVFSIFIWLLWFFLFFMFIPNIICKRFGWFCIKTYFLFDVLVISTLLLILCSMMKSWKQQLSTEDRSDNREKGKLKRFQVFVYVVWIGVFLCYVSFFLCNRMGWYCMF